MSKNINRRISTDLSMVDRILGFSMKQEVNAHGTCLLEGVVKEGCKDEFAKENNSDRRVKVMLEEESGSRELFCGIMGEISIFQAGEVYHFKIRLYSCTFLMDLKKKSRSFQNMKMTYEELIKKIMSDYEGGDIIDQLSGGKRLEELLVQYKETDWEFLKRVASHFHGSLLAACEFSSPKIFFGAGKSVHIDSLKRQASSMEKRIFQYQQYSANGYSEYGEKDAIRFQIEERNYYEIGSGVAYQNMQLYIGKIEASMDKGELLFHYELRTKQGMGQQPLYAEHLAGASIKAEVLESVRDKIKVKLEIDDVQEADTAWEFPYQTMYTAQDEGGWYCMPERGDQVMIYFPGKREAEAVGTTSSRGSQAAQELTENPEIKFFRTIYGKEIRFTPESVEIICEDKSSKRARVRIVLHQDEGIEIYSREGITFTSGKGIRLEAEEEIELTASERIRLHCKKSQIQMDNLIDIAGPDVRIN